MGKAVLEVCGKRQGGQHSPTEHQSQSGKRSESERRRALQSGWCTTSRKQSRASALDEALRSTVTGRDRLQSEALFERPFLLSGCTNFVEFFLPERYGERWSDGLALVILPLQVEPRRFCGQNTLRTKTKLKVIATQWKQGKIFAVFLCFFYFSPPCHAQRTNLCTDTVIIPNSFEAS